MEKIKIALYTLGCKVNFAESSTILRNIIKLNSKYEKVSFNEFANIYIINTCSVTYNADKKFKYFVNIALKNNSKAFIIAIGCYAQLNPKKLLKVNGVDLVLGANEKFNINNYINDITKKQIGNFHSCEINSYNLYNTSYSIDDRTRSFLKIQDGCDYKCSYCTIPLARGISRSEKLENILKYVQEISKKGIKEIVLTGINIGDYGKEINNGILKKEYSLLDLIKTLDKIKDIKRFRISSIEPNLLLDDIILFIKMSKRFVPHFHIPLQSGSDKILKKMRRRYLTDLYKEKIFKIKKYLPDACIGVDVIVGFPGESDNDFLKTYYLLYNLDISYIHVFTYSERDNTDAINMGEIIDKKIRQKRNKILMGLSAKKRFIFYKKNINTKKNVLFERTNKQGFIYGYTDNFIRIKTKWAPELVNSIKLVELIKIDQDGIMLIN